MDDCAEFLAARDEEAESEDEATDAAATEATWARHVAAKRKAVRRAIREGALATARNGSDARVTVGAFYDCLGEPTPIAPERGLHYDVRPDADAEAQTAVKLIEVGEVEERVAALEAAVRRVRWRPGRPSRR